MPRKKRIKLRKETVEALITGLKEIEGVFYVHEHKSNTEDESDDYFYELSYTQPEDVEVAVAEFVSELLRKQVLNQDGKQAPSFSTVFEQIYGEDHYLTARAQYFEELVEEYEEYVSLEDMQAAEEVIHSMIDTLTRDLEEGEEQSGKLF
jgi:hypothetical protein